MKILNTGERMVYNDQSLTKKVMFEDPNVVSFVLNFNPNQKLPSHKHEQSTVVLYVLTGGGELICSGEGENIKQGDIAYVTGEEEMSFNNGASPTSFLVSLCPNPKDKKYSVEV